MRSMESHFQQVSKPGNLRSWCFSPSCGSTMVPPKKAQMSGFVGDVKGLSSIATVSWATCIEDDLRRL